MADSHFPKEMSESSRPPLPAWGVTRDCGSRLASGGGTGCSHTTPRSESRLRRSRCITACLATPWPLARQEALQLRPREDRREVEARGGDGFRGSFLAVDDPNDACDP